MLTFYAQMKAGVPFCQAALVPVTGVTGSDHTHESPGPTAMMLWAALPSHAMGSPSTLEGSLGCVVMVQSAAGFYR